MFGDGTKKFLQQYVTYEDNILEHYDNVTYNIRFYILDSSYQKQISTIKSSIDMNKPLKIDDSKKIIIAETGVTSKYDITSMVVDTVYSSVYKNSSATTYKMSMIIKELNGCSLINKLAVISKLCGYQNHINQPYHVDIWFSGYEHNTGLPVKQIGEVLTYEVVISDVVTNVNDMVTNYNFSMVPISHGVFNKEVNSLWQIDTLQVEDNASIGKYKEVIEQKMNELYFQTNKYLKPYYPSGKYIHIDNLIIQDHKHNLQDYVYGKTNMSYLSNKNIDVSSIRVSSKPRTVTEKSSGDSDEYKNNYSNTFDGFFQRLCFKTEELKNYIARPVYRVEFIPNKVISGKELVEIHIDIIFIPNTYLTYYNNKSLSSGNLETLKKMEMDELENIIFSKALVKKYEFLFNGKDTSVLEINSNIDKMWLACLPMSYEVNTVTSTNSNLLYQQLHGNATKLSDDSISIEINKTEREIGKEHFSLKEILNMKTDYNIYDWCRSHSNKLMPNGKIYLDDLYDYLDNDIKKDNLERRNVLEQSNNLTNNTNNETAGPTNSENTAIVGYNNIFQSGNLVELKIKIIGDPYWLKQFSDIIVNNSNNANVMHNFVFSLKTPIGQNNDGTYNLEDTCEFSTIYQLVESSSVFEDGKFIQQLSGVINPAFMYAGIVKV